MTPTTNTATQHRAPIFWLINASFALWGILLLGGVGLSAYANQQGSGGATTAEGCFTIHWGAYAAIFYLSLALAVLALFQARGMRRIAQRGWFAAAAYLPLGAGVLALGLSAYTIGQYLFAPRIHCETDYWPANATLDDVVNTILYASLIAIIFGFVALAISTVRQHSKVNMSGAAPRNVATPEPASRGVLFTRFSFIIGVIALALLIPLALLQHDTPPATCWEYTGTSVIQFALGQDIIAAILAIIALGIARRSSLAIVPLLGSGACLVITAYTWAQSYHIDRRCYGYTPNADPFAHSATWLGPLAVFTYLGAFAIMLLALVTLNMCSEVEARA